MDKLRAVVAGATERAAGSRPAQSLRALLTPTPGIRNGERGQGLAEYALILALIAIVAIAALIFLGGSISAMFMDPISEDFGEILSQIMP